MRKFLVWGLGKSGQSAVKLLRDRGFIVFSGDDARGDRWEDYLGEVDTVVLSPGIPPSHPLWREALKREVEVIGEVELAYRFFKGNIIAVTGTDGKSTTTRLIYLMLSSSREDVHEAGNIGTPFSEVVGDKKGGLVVLEISSFQGKTLSTFKPNIGVFLNFHEDHLDWHPDLKDYLYSKYRIFMNQGEEDLFLIAEPQEEILSTPTKAKKVNLNSEIEIKGEDVILRNEKLFQISDLRIRGRHNLINAAVASAVARSMGVPRDNIRRVLREFEGLSFRMELVMKFRGVEIYNDSKSTTPNSLRAALESFPDSSVILIAGGKEKGADFEPLRDLVRNKVRCAILIGETKERMKRAFGEDISKTFSSLEEAVREAFRIAQPGNFILFSPGCSSFDMFQNYVERGEVFNRLVRKVVNYKYV